MLLTFAVGLALVQGGQFRTDTTVTVTNGTRVTASFMNGEVRVRTWDRNAVRVQAEHSSRTTVTPRLSGSVLRIEATGRMGIPSSVDLQLTVPVWMAAEFDGMNIDVDAEGMQGALKVGTMNGDLVVRGGADLDFSTMSGGVRAENVTGRVKLSAASGDIRMTGVRGTVSAATISGNIALARIDSDRVEAETTSGNVIFDGTIRDGGTYLLSAHSGSVYFAVPPGANATISSYTVSGGFTASFTLPAIEERSRYRRVARFGSGSASVELESFSGRIRLVRPGEAPSLPDRRGRSRNSDHSFDFRLQQGAWELGLDLSARILDDLDLGGLSGLSRLSGLSGLAGLGGLATIGADLGASIAEEVQAEVIEDLRRDLRNWRSTPNRDRLRNRRPPDGMER